MNRNDWKKRAVDIITSYDERAPYFLYASLAFNLIYAVFKLIVGIWMQSYWLIGLGGYYGMLAIMRFMLMRKLDCAEDGSALAAYRRTAWLLLLLTLIIGGIIAQTFLKKVTYEYNGILIFAFAAYAFAKIIAATVSLINKRHHEDRILAAARCVTFAQALMSLLALQVALLNRYGSDDPQFIRTMNGATGAAVCVLVILIAVGMLVRASKAKGKSEFA